MYSCRICKTVGTLLLPSPFLMEVEDDEEEEGDADDDMDTTELQLLLFFNNQ